MTTRDVPDSIYAEARQCFSESDLIEVTQLVGLYTGVAMLAGLIRPRFDHYQPGAVHTTAVPGPTQ